MTVLAEMLAERKDLVTKIGRLPEEIGAALLYDEGETDEATNEAFREAKSEYEHGLLDLLEALANLQRFEDLVRAANTATLVRFEGTIYSISEAIVLRDRLKTEFNARTRIADAVDEAIGRKRRKYDYERRKKDDVITASAVPGKALREGADQVAKRLRLLDAEIQKVNWSTEV